MVHLLAAKRLECPTSVDTLATRSLGLPLTNELELGLRQRHRFLRALDPNRDRGPLLEGVGVIEHDCTLDDLAGV